MSKKLFVGGLAWATKDEGLKNAFAPYGAIVEAKVICERETGRSRGFGFVTFENEDDALRAEAALNGTTLDGRSIRIDSAERSNAKRPVLYRGQRAGQGANDGQINPSSRHLRENHASNNRDANDRASSRYASCDNSNERRSHEKRDYASSPYNYAEQEPSKPRRTNRKEDRKSNRDRREDDERWQ